MEQVLQAAALCVTASLLAMVVRRGSPETALLLALGAAAVVLAALADPLAQVLAFAEELGRRSGISEELLAPLQDRGHRPGGAGGGGASAGTPGSPPWGRWWRRRGRCAPCWRRCH